MDISFKDDVTVIFLLDVSFMYMPVRSYIVDARRLLLALALLYLRVLVFIARPIMLKVMSSEMNTAEIRLIR